MKEFDDDKPLDENDSEYCVDDELDPEYDCVLDQFDEEELCNSDKINEYYQSQEEMQKVEQEYNSLLEEQKMLKAESENLFSSGEDCSSIEQALREKNQEIDETYHRWCDAKGRVNETRNGTIYEALDLVEQKKKNYLTDMNVARSKEEFKHAYHWAEASHKAREHFINKIYDIEHKKD